jgi:hypothetical protein
LAGHQIADDGFEVGLIDIGFRKCGSQVFEIVDDEIKGLIVPLGTIDGTRLRPMKNSKRNGYRENLSRKPRHLDRSGLPPTAARSPCNSSSQTFSTVPAFPLVRTTAMPINSDCAAPNSFKIFEARRLTDGIARPYSAEPSALS